MSDYFLLDPDYKDFPEKRKLKFLTVYGEQHTFIVMAVLGFLFSSLMFLLMLFSFSQEWPYLTRSQKTQAIVKASCQPTHKSFTYTFEAADAQGNRRQYLGEASQYKDNLCPQAGKEITIEYLPDTPESSARYMYEGTSSLINLLGWTIGLIFYIVFVRLAIKDIGAFLRACTQYPVLRKTKLILEGHIVAMKDSKDGHIQGRIRGAYCVEVEYNFIVNEQVLKGKQVHRREDLENKPLPPPGTPVRVLYADENTYVML